MSLDGKIEGRNVLRVQCKQCLHLKWMEEDQMPAKVKGKLVCSNCQSRDIRTTWIWQPGKAGDPITAT